MENVEEMIKVSDLGPRSRNVNMNVKVVEKGEVREIESRRDGSTHTVSESKVGDETGIVLLTLWDDSIDKIEEGKEYQIKNGYTTLFRGNIRLNIGRYGELEESKEKIKEVNEENNVSEKFYEDRGRGRGYGRY
jgi:replication factor A1